MFMYLMWFAVPSSSPTDIWNTPEQSPLSFMWQMDEGYLMLQAMHRLVVRYQDELYGAAEFNGIYVKWDLLVKSWVG